jgi:hypothetical protein
VSRRRALLVELGLSALIGALVLAWERLRAHREVPDLWLETDLASDEDPVVVPPPTHDWARQRVRPDPRMATIQCSGEISLLPPEHEARESLGLGMKDSCDCVLPVGHAGPHRCEHGAMETA